MGHFYPWASFDVVSNMDAETLDMYWQGITLVEARNTLLELDIACFPWGEKSEKDKFIKRVKDTAYPRSKITSDQAAVTTGEMALILSRECNG